MNLYNENHGTILPDVVEGKVKVYLPTGSWE
jgi:hypothetical protein